MRTLHQKWLSDKASALCAAVLAGTELAATDRAERLRLESANLFISKHVTPEQVAVLADSTLGLLENIPVAYMNPDEELLPNAVPLSDVRSAVEREVKTRDVGASRLPEILIAHAVYLLKQPHLTISDFLKWLKRQKQRETRDVRLLLKELDKNKRLYSEIDGLLDLSRDASEQTRDRIDAVDRLYDAVFCSAGTTQDMLWWMRICLSLRSSLYCWPLMVAGSSEHGLHGMSLPIGMFLSQDGNSKVYFKIVNPKGSYAHHRRYVRWSADVWAHMEGSQLQWDDDWGKSFQAGLHVAKGLWSTQNGRLRFVDEAAAAAMLNASLVIDLGAACAIVDSIFDSPDGAPYRLSGRSAEAYWVQAILGLMLPGHEIPLGVVTGRVETAEGVHEIRHVEGVRKKLEYANNAGFSRVVLPSAGLEDSDFDLVDAWEMPSGQSTVDSEMDPAEVLTSPSPVTAPQSVIRSTGASSCEDAEAFEALDARNQIQAFLRSLAESNTRKRVEINLCRTIRSAADAMQMSGWRRSTFIRLPVTQRAFSIHVRRLFLHEKISQGGHLLAADRRDYDRNPWTANESGTMRTLDEFLLSGTRAIKFLDRAKLDQAFSKGAEAEIGKWLAWKDHQVRGGNDEDVRGPGLGILCLRSTETDNEMRLWSAIAETLSASPGWWNNFQWATLNQAAQLLAQLLGNQRGNPSICATPAPDILVLFDEGNLSQRRSNPIFPDDFRGQWLDLLNASKDNQHAGHPLNSALLEGGEGRLGCTRIIVVYGQPSARSPELPDTLDDDDKDAVARLAVFRFDFSKQAAYAMMNYGRGNAKRFHWSKVDRRLRTLVNKKVLFGTRGRFYIAPQFLPKLREKNQYYSDPQAHVHAAGSLAPILEPRDLFIASNRDRTLEPESAMEATWHLQRARVLVPGRYREIRTRCDAALATLTFLRPFPDWDTVKLLQRSQGTLGDAVELGRELLDHERSITNQQPHSSRVAALLNAIGCFGRSVSRANADSVRAQLVDEATTMCTNALMSFEAANASDLRRQKRKLFSEYIYCMKMLDVPDGDQRLSGALSYLEGTIDEVVKGDFYHVRNLDDYPLSGDWLKARWDSTELTLKDRSTHAYVAARLHIDRWRDGELVQPWDQPWIEYFALTTTEDFDARQLHSPLTTWQNVYGRDKESTNQFGQRIRDFSSYMPSRKAETLSWWGLKIRAATRNLWNFINHFALEKQLRPHEAAIALKLIRVMTLHETLPAFDFIERCGREWLTQWPEHLDRSFSQEWNKLAALVTSGGSGWTSMLSSFNTLDEESIRLVLSWLHAYRVIGSDRLYFCDPEDLRLSALPLADGYRRKSARAIWNGYQLLSERSERGWLIYGHLRAQYVKILRELCNDCDGWFFALADRKPHPAAVAGACMMLEHCVPEDGICKIVSKPAFEHLRHQLLRNIPAWTKNTGPSGRVIFEKLRNFLLRCS